MKGDRRAPRSELWPSLGIVLGGLLWGVFWLPLRALGELGLEGAWPSAIVFLASILVLLPALPWRWGPVAAPLEAPGLQRAFHRHGLRVLRHRPFLHRSGALHLAVLPDPGLGHPLGPAALGRAPDPQPDPRLGLGAGRTAGGLRARRPVPLAAEPRGLAGALVRHDLGLRLLAALQDGGGGDLRADPVLSCGQPFGHGALPSFGRGRFRRHAISRSCCSRRSPSAFSWLCSSCPCWS